MKPSRRAAAGLLVGVATLWLAACAVPPVAPCLAPGCGVTTRAVEVASGVYMLPGSAGVAEGHNLGRIGNAGFIVGEAGVLAIDTGTSYAHGRALLGAISAVTDKPVVLALVTHARPEFLFGGAAFRERSIPIVMHTQTARLMASRCEGCLKQLRGVLGDAALRGTAMYRPDREFDAPHTIALIGRAVRVLYFGHSSGPGDIAVFDEHSGVLFGGGLLDWQRIPDLQDSQLEGWGAALAALRELRISAVVPGHGPATSSAVISAVQRYLEQLEARARALAEAGASLLDVPDAIDLPEFSHWEQYDTIHRRNAGIAYLRFERELLLR